MSKVNICTSRQIFIVCHQIKLTKQIKNPEYVPSLMLWISDFQPVCRGSLGEGRKEARKIEE
jgi:hypothetical protein